jgi:hypothetical protein
MLSATADWANRVAARLMPADRGESGLRLLVGHTQHFRQRERLSCGREKEVLSHHNHHIR